MTESLLTANEIWTALLLTLIAGMSTGIGCVMALCTKKTDTKMLSMALGLSAGVMVYVSFMEIIPECMTTLQSLYSATTAQAYMLFGLFGGMGLITLIDWLIPESGNPHESHCHDGTLDYIAPAHPKDHLRRTGVMLAVIIAIHNFPEGIATFVSALEGIDIALPVVAAIFIHNIPEGIAVSVPIYQATGSRRKALWYGILSGLAEPLGAVCAVVFLMPLWTPVVNALCMAAVAGIMIYISFDELLPNSESYGHHHWAIGGVVAGMVVMGFGLLLF